MVQPTARPDFDGCVGVPIQAYDPQGVLRQYIVPGVVALNPDGSIPSGSPADAMTSAQFLANLRSTATKGTPVNSGTSSVTLLAANANRKGAAFVNTDANILYIDISGGTATNTGVPVASGGYYELPFGITNAITGIWAADGAGVSQSFEAA